MLVHMSNTRTATWLTPAASLLITLVLALTPVGSAYAAGVGTSGTTVSDLTPKPEPTPSVEPKTPEPTPSVEIPKLSHTGVSVSGVLIAFLVLVSMGLLTHGCSKH